MAGDDKPGVDKGGRAPRNLSLDPEEMQLINDHLKLNPQDLFKIPNIRALVAMSRLAKVAGSGGVQVLESTDDAVIENTVSHNMGGLTGMKALDRPTLLINALSSIYYVFHHAASLQVLSVGPRSEAEILALIAAGFMPENIHGLDLISYSEFVDLGDMHAMPYEDNTFDIVFLGWVISYSNDVGRVAKEAMRVAKPGAHIAIGVERNPRSIDELADESGYRLDSTEFETTDQLLKLFEGRIAEVPFRNDVHETMMDEVSHVMVIFRLT
ncbi:MAG: class I SAM-dependent methyltransferase [Rhodospirillales bacterium]|nr:class I SAM-dependent methyltransferase [Rhodospirillales bacterium]